MITIEKVHKQLEHLRKRGKILEDRCPEFMPTKHGGAYGMYDVVAQYAGLQEAPFPQRRDDWIHGWVIKENNNNPKELTGRNSSSHNQSMKWWAWREDQATAMRTLGFKSVKAVGAPICYVKAPEHIERIPKSILIMPIHGDLSDQYNWNESKLAIYAAQLKRRFNYVAACIYPMDIAKGRWVKELNQANIPIISGALWCDGNALKRIAFLFSKFETIVSNGFGSHLLYPHLFGARSCIDITMDFKVHNTEDYPTENIYTRDKMHNLYPFLFCPPEDSTSHLDWARHELGWHKKLMPDEITQEFGWTDNQEKIYKLNKAQVARDSWTYGRHLCRLGMRSQAQAIFNQTNDEFGSDYIYGSGSYVMTAKVLGPYWAERIGEITSLSR